MTTILRTKLGYLKKPLIYLYLPSQKQPIVIQSNILKVDSLRQDFIFQDKVVVKLKTGILKTNFLKVNAKRQEMTSFDLYTFHQQEKTIHGRSFYGSAQSQKIQFLNIQNFVSRSSSVSLL